MQAVQQQEARVAERGDDAQPVALDGCAIARFEHDVAHSSGVKVSIFSLDRRNNSLSSVSSLILHRLVVSICEAELNKRSTAAELGKVEFTFLNASATAGNANKVLTDSDFEARYPSTCMV